MSKISNLESKHKLLFLIFIVSMFSLISTMIFGSNVSSIYVLIFSLVFCFITKAVWLPDGHGTNKNIRYIVSVSLLVCTSSQYSVWNAKVSNAIISFLPEGWFLKAISETNPNISSIPILIFLFGIVYVINKNALNKPVMGERQSDFDKDIPEPEFHERLKNALDALEDDMRSINKQTNWSGSLFTPLDAEVYIKTGSGRKRKVTDLLRAMKNKNGRAFLVLGEPGSGKSVALRKLSLDLIKEVKNAQKIPLYINLKEWVGTSWTVDSPPTEEELYCFVKNNVARRDRALSIFVDKYFDRLYETKRFFFIFDSFDEIPQVMNVDEKSMLIDQLSNVLFKFIKDKNGHTAGILASRQFRKPTGKFQASSEIEIRPFNDAQIIKTIRKLSSNSSDVINDIFRNRVDLYSVAKNPFMASMIAKYIEIYEKLPSNQLEMFSVFIDDAINDSHRKLHETSLRKTELINAAKEIAKKMFSEYGLEAPILGLKADFPDINIDAVIDCLKFARIVRASSVDEGRVSFVHRRFCEYFVVLDKLENDAEIPFEVIPRDSQWRDALVLYCEVASKDKAAAIADKCWSIIKNDNGVGSLEAIHCMRFLRDAFKGRTDCVGSFQAELEEFISTELDKDNAVYWIKLVVELLCLARVEKIEKNVIKSLEIGDAWICETAIESCRNLSSISSGLEKSIASYLNGLSDYKYILSFSSHYFTFGISSAFYKIKRFLKIRMMDLFFLIAIILLSLCLYPLITLLSIVFVLCLTSLAYFISYFMTPKIKNDKNIENKDRWVIGGSFFSALSKFKKLSVFSVTNVGEEENISPRKLNGGIYVHSFSEAFHNTISTVKIMIVGAPLMIIYLAIIDVIFKGGANVVNFSVFNIHLVVLLCLGYLAVLFSCLRIKLLFLEKIEGKSSWLFVFFVVAFLAIIPVVFFLLGKYYKLFLSLIGVVYLFGGLVFIPAMYRGICSFVKSYKIFKTVQPELLCKRERIYQYIKMLEGHPIFIGKLISLIEVNVSEASGEWPDNSILKISAGRYASKLSQLDARWRRID